MNRRRDWKPLGWSGEDGEIEEGKIQAMKKYKIAVAGTGYVDIIGSTKKYHDN